MAAESEIVVKVTADMERVLRVFDVVIEEMTDARDRIRERLDLIARGEG